MVCSIRPCATIQDMHVVEYYEVYILISIMNEIFL